MAASAYSQVLVPRPKVWQDFEQGSSILWRKILDDDSLNRFGRGGQEQHGMDMYGYRKSDTAKIVGIQCKCKGHDKQATEKEFREDFEKALKWEPRLTEYFFTTTADDHGPLHTVAAKLTEEQRLLGRHIIVRAWGWGTIEQRLAEHECAYVFDPSHSASTHSIDKHMQELNARLDTIQAVLPTARVIPDDAVGQVGNSADAHLDEEINRYRDLLLAGQPKSALKLFRILKDSLPEATSGHIWFRIKANIGHCYLHLGDEKRAVEFIEEAIAHAPEEPKAIANNVLALILRGKNQDALDLALAELSKDDSNETIAAYAVQAAGYLGKEDPLVLIPEGLRESRDVQHFYLTNLRADGGLAWVEVARRATLNWPDDAFFTRHLAEGEIETIVTGQHAKTWLLESGDREILANACGSLIRLWNEAKEQEVPERQDNLALCSNAVIALILLGDNVRAKELVKEGLAIAGDQPDLLIRAAAVAVETRDREFGLSVFSRLPTEGPGLLLRMQIAGIEGDWKYLSSLYGSTSIDSVPETEIATVKALVGTAHAKILAKRDRVAAEKLLGSQVIEFAGKARPMVLIGQMADDLGFKDVSKSAYLQALGAINDGSHIANRVMVAEYANRRSDHSSVIKLLDGYIDTSTPSDELDQLSSAFAYQYPPKARAVGFFEDLPESIRQEERMVVWEGIMHFHRQDMPAAKERFAAAVQLSPGKLRPLLMLAQVLLRQKDRPAVVELVGQLDLAVISGSPIDHMHVAHLLAMGGRVQEAFALGFDTLEANRNDPAVNLKWIGLGLGNMPQLFSLSDAPVDVGMWTRVVSSDGQSHEFTIVDGPNRPADGRYAKDHSLAGAAIGHRVGETFHITDGLGRDRAWTVDEVRHRYHHAYDNVTEHFNDRFPNENGFWVIKTQGEDIQPILDVMRRQGERQENILELYQGNSVPLSVIVEVAGGNVISFAETLRANGIEIDTCDNTEHERLQAMKVIRDHKGKGAVLDNLTHWTVVGLEAVDVLQAVFGRLLVPRSTLDDILQLGDDDEKFEGTEKGGTAFFHKGQYYFDEMTPERENARVEALAKRERSLSLEFEVMPVHAPDDFDDNIGEHVQRGALDPVFVAREFGMVLISDDKRFRHLARAMKVEGLWLQSVFYFAVHNGLISPERYAILTSELASLQHTSVAFEARDVLNVVEQFTPDTQYRLHALARCIGTKNADVASHLSVLLETTERLWNAGPTLNGKKAVSLLVQNMLRHHPRWQERILAAVGGTLSGYLGGTEFFENWKVGHFIQAQRPTLQKLPNTESVSLS